MHFTVAVWDHPLPKSVPKRVPDEALREEFANTSDLGLERTGLPKSIPKSQGNVAKGVPAA